MPPTTPMQPPTAHLPADADPPTLDDPTAGGVLCGAQRRPGQIQQDREAGIDEPWPYCGSRAGRGTDHPGIGRCKDHGGNAPSHRRAAQLRYAELQGAAVAGFARIAMDESAPYHARLRAWENIADRGGSPRRTEVDVESARETLYQRLLALQAGDEASS